MNDIFSGLVRLSSPPPKPKEKRPSKTQLLLAWAKDRDWFYLSEVPHETFGMTKATASSALIAFCNQGKMDFRVLGLKQYRIKND